MQSLNIFGAIEGTRTPTPLRVHGPEPCASANSATMASSSTRETAPEGCLPGKENSSYSTELGFSVNLARDANS
jgi:hypothetical protein